MHEIARRILSSRGRALIFADVLAVVTILAYQPAWHGGILWDDDATYRESRVAFPGWFEANLVRAKDDPAILSSSLYFLLAPAKAVGAIRPLAITWSIFFCTSAVSCWC